MHILTETDQAIVFSVIAGFISGTTYGIIDKIYNLFVENEKLVIKITIRQCITTGCAMAIVFSLITFLLISTTFLPYQAIIQLNIILTIVFPTVGLVADKIYKNIASKYFHSTKKSNNSN